jgi:Trk K+ transport system NAD-binding subunit/nucleotide-binding universal stress UspA family protein
VADDTPQAKILIVGAGTTGRELVRRFAGAWPVSIVDIDRQRLDLIKPVEHPENLRKTIGDGTSRLVLEGAGIRGVDYVIAVSSTDEVNLEVCRIAREDFGKENLYAAVQDYSKRERYREADVDFVTPSYAAAVNLENRVLYGVGTSLAAAEARGEVIEVAVLPSSPMIGRPLSSVRSRRWHVGAIYRKDQLVIPTGPTRIEADDRVVLIGEKEILPSIGQFFRIGDPEFPLEFGSNVVILTESSSDFEETAEELGYLLDNSRARSVEILFWPHEPGIQNDLERILQERGIEAATSPVFGNYGNVAAKHVVTRDCGFLIVPDERFRFLERLGIRRTALSTIIRQMDVPIGILRGSQPYEKILVPITELDRSMHVARLAFDLARIYRASVTMVTVTAPRFVVGGKAIDDQKEALAKMTHLANLYHLTVNEVHREGNPIEEVLKLCPEYNLMVLAHGKDRRPSFFDPDVSQHLLRRAPITTLILPH